MLMFRFQLVSILPTTALLDMEVNRGPEWAVRRLTASWCIVRSAVIICREQEVKVFEELMLRKRRGKCV